MKTQILSYWHNQYILSGKNLFPAFLNLLAQGGQQALAFIDNNVGLIETVGGSAEVIKATIETDTEAAENKAWFFSQAMTKLRDVRSILSKRFASTVVFAQSLGVSTEGWSAETIVPCINAASADANTKDGYNDLLDKHPKADLIKALQSVGVEIKGNASKAVVLTAIDTLEEAARASFLKAMGIAVQEDGNNPDASDKAAKASADANTKDGDEE